MQKRKWASCAAYILYISDRDVTSQRPFKRNLRIWINNWRPRKHSGYLLSVEQIKALGGKVEREQVLVDRCGIAFQTT